MSLPGREPWQGQGRFAPVARRPRWRPRPDLQLLCGVRSPRRSRRDRQARRERGAAPQHVPRAGARKAQDDDSRRPRPLARGAARRRHSRRNLSSRARLHGAAARDHPVSAALSLFEPEILRLYDRRRSGADARNRRRAADLSSLGRAAQSRCSRAAPRHRPARRRRVAPRAGRGTYRPMPKASRPHGPRNSCTTCPFGRRLETNDI